MKTQANIFRRLAKKTINTFGIKSYNQRLEVPQAPPEEVIASLDPSFREPLLSMYRGEHQIGADGQMHGMDSITKIRPSQGMWLYELCVSIKPKATIEIGLAYGYSTLYFLAAIAKTKTGHHTSIDPFQHSYSGIGLAHAKALAPRNATGSTFEFIEDRSDRAAVDLARSNRTFDVVFIDGNHRFDDVLVDFCLFAPLCAMDGYVVFDDTWMESIQVVVKYLRSNRNDFVEIPTPETNISVFKKVGEDIRAWDEFQKFM